MSVLVTGGCGFIGSYVTRELLEADRDVAIYDARPEGSVLHAVLPPHLRDHPALVEGSVLDVWTLTRTIKEYGVDSIVHLASPLVHQAQANPYSAVSEICLGSTNVFEAALAAGIPRVVWTSSVAVFGLTHAPYDLTADDAAQKPNNLYGACKALTERIGERYQRETELDTIGLRLTLVYGVGRIHGRSTFLGNYVREVALNRPVTIKYGDQRYSWQYVKDVARAVTAALAAPRDRSATTYNTAGDLRSGREAAHALCNERPDAKIDVEDGVDPIYSRAPMNLDDSLARVELAFAPQFSLELGIRDALSEFDRIAEESPESGALG